MYTVEPLFRQLTQTCDFLLGDVTRGTFAATCSSNLRGDASKNSYIRGKALKVPVDPAHILPLVGLGITVMLFRPLAL